MRGTGTSFAAPFVTGVEGTVAGPSLRSYVVELGRGDERPRHVAFVFQRLLSAG